MPKIAELVLISVEKSTSRSLKGKKIYNDLKHGENEVNSLVMEAGDALCSVPARG